MLRRRLTTWPSLSVVLESQPSLIDVLVEGWMMVCSAEVRASEFDICLHLLHRHFVGRFIRVEGVHEGTKMHDEKNFELNGNE